MILACHQPYFFPYLGYFSLISAVEKFVFLDTSQFNRRSWMTRNRILKPNLNEFQYIKIGLQHSPFHAMLPECKLTTNDQWKVKLRAQLEHSRKKATYYEETMSFLTEILNNGRRYPCRLQCIKYDSHCTAVETRHPVFFSIPQLNTVLKRPRKVVCGGWFFSAEFGAGTYINAPDGEKFVPKGSVQKSRN